MNSINPALIVLALSTLPGSALAMINDCKAVAAGNPGESALNATPFAAAGSPSELASDTSLPIAAANSSNSHTYLNLDNGGPGGQASLVSASSAGTASPDGSNPGSNHHVSHQDSAPGLAAIEKIWPNDSHVGVSRRGPHDDRAVTANTPPQMLIAPDGLNGDHEIVLDLLLDARMFSDSEIGFDNAPEAATVILLGLGLYGIGVARRR